MRRVNNKSSYDIFSQVNPKGLRNLDKNTRNAIIVIALLFFTGAGIQQGWFATGFSAIASWFGAVPPPPPPPTYEESAFKYSAFALDTSTAVTSATTRVWYDANSDGKMTYSEIGRFTESSGVYTSDNEYPIGSEYDLWVQCYATNYQVTYQLMHITGSRNTDGSAKTVGSMDLIATDDSVTYDGMINKVAWDDSSDYNATLKGTSGLAEISIVLSAADKGLSSQVWEAVDYMSVYGVTKDYDYFVKWDQITEGGIPKAAILAPDFFGIYMTLQDKADLNPSMTDFDGYYQGVTNFFFFSTVTDAWGDLFYNSADSAAPRPTISFDVGTVTAAGTTVATYGVRICTGLTYEQMVSGVWTESAACTLGTGGNDWDWTI